MARRARSGLCDAQLPKQMKIAQIAPLYESVPPKLYGGTERVVATLSNELVQCGHDVTLFASADSRTSALLVPVRDRAIRLDVAPLKSDVAAHLAMLHEVKRHTAQFDILHFHTEMLHMPIFEKHASKCVTTVHGRLDMADLSAAYGCWPDFGLISVSNNQRRPLATANWIATVAHGLPIERYPFQPHPCGNYLAFLGRASPEKGLDTAINIARRAGLPLKIAAKIESVDRPYFESVIEPMLQPPSIEFMGEIAEEQKPGFLGNALALLFPIRWPEPFGLVMIEAMACGTPVIAFNRGAVPEIVEHGVSGFIVETEDEALHAIGRLHELGRRRVRAIVDDRFTAQTMGRGYLDAYSRWIESQRLGLAS